MTRQESAARTRLSLLDAGHRVRALRLLPARYVHGAPEFIGA